MDAQMLVAIISVAGVAVGIVLFLRHTGRHHPVDSHAPADQPAQAAAPPIGKQRYAGQGRPAGPGAESEAVTAPGELSPGRP